MSRSDGGPVDGRRKLLIVDDSDDIRMVLEFFFKDKRYEVRTARSGDEALEIASEFRPDVVLLDHNMPGLSGIDTFKALRQFDPKLRVIVLSASDPEEAAAEVLQSGVDRYVCKSADLEHLDRIIREL